jgi:hypothetical protein
MYCEICKKRKASFSAIVGDVYYKDICTTCKLQHNKVSTGHADWNRTIDLQDHEHEILQPYNADGTINTKFARLYPKQAKALFTDVELRNANL